MLGEHSMAKSQLTFCFSILVSGGEMPSSCKSRLSEIVMFVAYLVSWFVTCSCLVSFISGYHLCFWRVINTQFDFGSSNRGGEYSSRSHQQSITTPTLITLSTIFIPARPAKSIKIYFEIWQKSLILGFLGIYPPPRRRLLTANGLRGQLEHCLEEPSSVALARRYALAGSWDGFLGELAGNFFMFLENFCRIFFRKRTGGLMWWFFLGK